MKVAGLLIIFLSSSLSGVYLTIKEKTNIAIIDEISRLLRFISAEISMFRKPLGEIFLEFDSPLLDKCGFSETLGSKGWEKAVTKHLPRSQERQILLDYGASLGKGIADTESENAARCAEILERAVREKQKKYPDKARVYLCLGAAVGIALVIMGL